MAIHQVGIVGGGTMGSGIAEVCAKNGIETTVVEINAELAELAQQRVTDSASRAVERAKMSQQDCDAMLGKMSFTTELAALSTADLVVEAVVELPEVKFELFAALDSIVKPEGILASNTSSIPIVEIGSVTKRPEQVLGMHFFNPATVQPLVELISSQLTSDSTMDTVLAFVTDVLGKHPIHTGDRAGFVVNRLLIPYILQAIEMVDRAQATKEDIDAGMRFGCAHPMGPLELADLIGLDTIQLVAEVLYDEFKEPTYAPPALLKRMVSAGQLGRKTGTGFYDYGDRRSAKRA